jgi:hypothetical protein
MSEATVTDKGTVSIKMGKLTSEGDWINRVMAEHCTVELEPAVEAVAAVAEEKDVDGNITQEAAAAVRGRAAKIGVDVDAVYGLAAMNGLILKTSYPNMGGLRMAAANRLRAFARKSGGLHLPGDGWTEAPADFEVNEKLTLNQDGTKISAAKPEKTADAA